VAISVGDGELQEPHPSFERTGPQSPLPSKIISPQSRHNGFFAGFLD